MTTRSATRAASSAACSDRAGVSMTTTSTPCAGAVARAPGRARGLHSKHKRGFGAAAGAPLAGGRLGIDVEHNGGPAGLLDRDGNGKGERGFPS